ncbi:hypothetical protein B0T24DRAFT_701216 [Lasiosphaeria ovina]|uniref:Uncharacterized protein n=1 Tax=Lasiosphaeria ovina TaxID=92902 RepID=A0AAE0KJ07_9PEZI|nr:hypothetical protein B0T24DRAFT_701216 [Lasiosphaeria ovina]
MKLYREVTLHPIQSIAASLENGDRPEAISSKLRLWRERKLAELHLVQVAGSLLAAAVIGSFSWTSQQEPHWIGPAAWLSSLVLAFSAVLLASSQMFIFRNAAATWDDAPRDGRRSALLAQELAFVVTVGGHDHHARARRRSFGADADDGVFDLGVRFIVGLVVYVAAPLHNEPELTGPGKGAIVFLGWRGVSGFIFMWCSYWGYEAVNYGNA